jgi:amidase
VTGYSPAADTVFRRAVEAMRRAGATIVDTVDIPFLGQYGGDELEVLLHEFREELNRYLAGLGPDARVRSLEEVIAFNRADRERSMPFFGQEILEMAQARGPLTDTVYLRALERAQRLARQGLDSVMRTHRLDAVVAPTGSPAWPIDLINGDNFLGASSTAPAVAGYPNVTVPAGHVFGLPVGISFIGAPWSEPTLIRLAYAFEQATRHRRPPAFLPTAELSRR